MSDEIKRSRRRRGGGGRSDRSRSRRPRFDDVDDGYDDADELDDGYDDAEPAPARGGSRGRGGRRGRSRGGSRSRGEGGRRGGGRGGFDWSALDDDEADGPERGGGYDDYDEYEDEPARRPRRPRRQAPAARSRVTLMDLCTPVFGFAAILPRDDGATGGHPAYEPFREQVVTALNKIESEAPRHGIEIEDAKHASYALCLLMDTVVAESEWEHKDRWAAEPLHIMIQQDAEGGVNFFRRLDQFGERQKDVKEVFLVCLAMGFRGKYAEMEATQQAAQIGEIRQKLVREVHPVPLEKQRELFPKAYQPAEAIEDEVPPPPRWWMFASLGVVAGALLIWLVLFWIAGRSPEAAREELAGLEVRPPAPSYVPPTPVPIPATGEASPDEGAAAAGAAEGETRP
jgi:type VI secretion system protein ImpK